MPQRAADRFVPQDRTSPQIEAVYANYDFLKQLTRKRFKDNVLAEEAYSYAFEGLAQNDWKRVRAYQEKASFRSYLGCVWCRLIEDFYIKKFGKVTPPRWIQNLGGVWKELFKLLCRQRLSADESIEKILDEGRYDCSMDELEMATDDILTNIPTCGRKVGQVSSLNDDQAEAMADFPLNNVTKDPCTVTIRKEKWIALQALAKSFFKQSAEELWNAEDSQKLTGLIAEIRKRLPLNEEEQLILITHFVDGLSITDIGMRLGLNPNQIHGKFRRLMTKIRLKLPDLLKPYI